MRIATAIVSMVALSAGALGGSAAYQLASVGSGPRPAATETTVPPVEEAPAVVARGARFGWEPCRAPAVRQGKACVTEVVRTVVLPAPAVAPAAAVPVEAPSTYAGDDNDNNSFDDDDSYDEDHEDHEDD